jgi:hypothetical protein
VRASLGLGTTRADIARLADALARIASHGPRTRYVHDAERDEYQPVDDRRRWPNVPFAPEPLAA